MLWWQAADLVGHVHGALAHLNEARETERFSSPTRVCELYFHALNRLWNALSQHDGEPVRADTPAFVALVQGIVVDDRERLLRSASTAALAEFAPHVLDHNTLRTRGYRPGAALSDRDRRDATEKHRTFKNAYARCVDSGDGTSLAKKLAEFLFVIRSNIAHGEKTPYGPDLEKARRDEAVSALTVPLQKALVDAVLDQPDRKLIAYGTLRPGQPNSAVLGGMNGVWLPCRVHGVLREVQGLPQLRWDPSGGNVDAMLLLAPDLPTKWESLDHFEGRGYRRRLVTATVEDQFCVANCYEAAQ